MIEIQRYKNYITDNKNNYDINQNGIIRFKKNLHYEILNQNYGINGQNYESWLKYKGKKNILRQQNNKNNYDIIKIGIMRLKSQNYEILNQNYSIKGRYYESWLCDTKSNLWDTKS